MKNKQIFNFILHSLKSFKFWIFIQILVATIWALDVSLKPYILKKIIDKISYLTPETAFSGLVNPILLYLFISLFLMIAFRFYDYSWLKLNPPLKRHIGEILIKRMMNHSPALFQTHFSGTLANKIKDVMSGIPDLIRLIIKQFYSHFIALMIAIFTVSTIHYKFSLLLLSWISLFAIGSAFFAKRAKYLCETAAEIRSVVMGQMVDILTHLFSIHLFATSYHESKKFKRHLDHYMTADQKRDWWFLGMFAFQSFIYFVYQIFVFFFLIFGFQQGTVTAGDFVLVISINIAINETLWSLSGDLLQFSEIIGNITQGLHIVLSPFDIQDHPKALPLKVNQGKIVFNHVNFCYKEANPLFKDLSISIEPGQKVGLVGHSGGGKSTFVNLLLRLYEVQSGHILIDNQNISDVTQDSLHQHIAIIPQDLSLFHRTLFENIHYGRPEANDEDVYKASRYAHAHDFIVNLYQGYDSLVGERGIKLSGGQRQRIAIARAFLKNSPILILDEATSQLDSLTEKEIQTSLWKLMENKTTLVIAHRLSTLIHMDRILVFDNGNIVEQGTHQDLLSQGGLYKTLWETQGGGFL